MSKGDKYLEVETQLLPVKLTEGELLAKADELVRTLHAIKMEKADQDDAKSAMKGRLVGLEKDADQLANIVRSKSEMREVETKVRLVDEKGVVETFRIDTGEVIGTRVMTGEERNLKLFPREVEAVTAPAE
jgi:hypothetical protein